MKKEKINAFTLIEILIVTAILLIIVGAVSSLFFSSLKGATKTAIINEAKQSGDYALSVMERMIRNATLLNSSCPLTSPNSIAITNPDGHITTFDCPQGSEVRIASSSSSVSNPIPTPYYLTSNKVAVSSCSFACVQSGASPAVVKISFSIHQLTPSPAMTLKPEELVNINYSTSVVVRNTGF